MIFIFLNDTVFAGRRFVTFFPGRDVRFADEMFALIKIRALFVKVNDDFRRTFEIITMPIRTSGMRRGESGPESIRKNPAWTFQTGLKLSAARAQQKCNQAGDDSEMEKPRDHEGAHSNAPGRGFNCKGVANWGPGELAIEFNKVAFERPHAAMNVRTNVFVVYFACRPCLCVYPGK